MNFKDHFSGHAQDYSVYRPGYPKQLFSYLASLCHQRERAWDCATGSGQSAFALAEHFAQVIATDASENQIANAELKTGVLYKVEPAEHSSLQNASADLITVAQALHWFDLDAFSREVCRVLKPQGILAIWTYGLHRISRDVDELVDELYGPTLDNYWPPERARVEQGYNGVQFPLSPMPAPGFSMSADWNLSQLTGYLCTWSAVKMFEQDQAYNPVEKLYDQLAAAWGKPAQTRAVQWPLTLKLWKKVVV